MGVEVRKLLLLHAVYVILLLSLIFCVSSDTDSQDLAALLSLKSTWGKTPTNWGSSDPCGTKTWDGVACTGSRVTTLKLSSLGLTGTIADISSLTQLEILDLSSNPGFTGTIPASIGKLSNLKILILAGCSFTGSIPTELGNLAQLTFLALNNNNLTGTIPPSMGKLSKLYWFDIAENQITGNIPVSNGDTPGLDQLLSTKHFHFNKNQLSGFIPSKLFSSQMVLIHVLFDGNELSGSIPSTLGLVTTLQVLRLDRNSLSGRVPSNLNNLSSLNELNLANNKLTGPLPNLTALNSLDYVDLSNNSFDASLAPSWFQTILTLTTLIIEYGSLGGAVPSALFSLPALQKVSLRNNSFNGTLDMGNYISPSLQYVDLQNNQISARTVGNTNYANTLLLFGNPGCSSPDWRQYCQKQALETTPAYSTSLARCGAARNCASNQLTNPKDCQCAYPYQGTMHFRAPYFSDLSNGTAFGSLEREMWTKLDLSPGSVFLQNPYFDSSSYMVLSVALFPSNGQYFSSSDVVRIGFALSNQSFKPPHEFGPYYFIASPYSFPDGAGSTGSLSSGVIAGIAVGCSFLIILLVFVAIYAVKQKRRAEKAIVQTQPFASWGGASSKDTGEAPKLKGARWFTFDEIKKCTNNFSEYNEIGSGGYGQVYRGILPGGQLVAVKKAKQGSMQGAHEFKTEIELLSRVHHKNLVTLVGFCYDHGEQMLVYEFIPNGNLRESLSGQSGVHLDWKKRLRISLGSARGLAYLHELADPPIIHRDVKSSNILLDENLNGKVADFGLSKLMSDSEKGHVSTQVKGTMGYLDPEYYMTQQLTEKSDVYSFGVVMLELVTAKQPIEKGKYIVREVKTAMDDTKELYGLREMLDPAIRNAATLPGLQRYVDLAMQCVEESADNRPTMGELVKEIETILQSEGMATNPASASTSATDFGTSNATAAHPYTGDSLLSKGINSDAFNFSGAHTISDKLEIQPK